MALGIISIIYAALFRLCCGVANFVSSLMMMLFATEGMQALMNLPQMEGMQQMEAMLSGPMQSYNLIKGFILLVLGLGMLVGGIGLIRLRPWGRSLSLGIAAAEIAWALVDFVINVFFIFPMITQSMGEEFAETPQIIGSVVGGMFGTFMALIYPVVLLICLNLETIKRQFANGADSQYLIQ